MIFMI